MNAFILVPLIAWWAASAGADYVRGMAFARMERWEEARAAFEAGAVKAPRDKRFPLELAGVAYRQGARGRAKVYLRRALALDPADTYASEFLGSVYFLEGNVEGALKYWNRAHRPRVEEVRFDPEPRLDPALADRALVFSPAEILFAEEYVASRKRLDFLGVFADARIALESRGGDGFDAVVHAPERRAGWLSLLRGLPFETVYPELPDIRGSGASVASLIRWDANKRRVRLAFASPLARDPGWRVRLGLDARDENWSVPGAGEFNLRKAEGWLDLARMTGSGTEWAGGFALSSRSVPVSREGVLLKVRGSLRRDLIRVPERNLVLAGSISGELGRLLEGDAGLFGKIEAGLQASWRALVTRIRAGTLGGDTPFDELFMLGVERDSDLWLRGHAATHEGKKGSGPLGRSFALANVECQQPLWRPGFATLSAGPFVDLGRVWRGTQSRWLADPGLQATLRAAAGPEVALSWSRRTVYVAVSPLNW